MDTPKEGLGQVFTDKDLFGGGGGDDELSKINQILGNIDSLLGHIVDIKEKHPELLAKFGGGGGGSNPFMPKGGGGLSPSNQPTVEGKVVKKISAEKLYTLLLGMLHTLEGKGLTIEQAKQLCIQNKSAIIAKLKVDIPTLEE